MKSELRLSVGVSVSEETAKACACILNVWLSEDCRRDVRVHERIGRDGIEKQIVLIPMEDSE